MPEGVHIYIYAQLAIIAAAAIFRFPLVGTMIQDIKNFISDPVFFRHHRFRAKHMNNVSFDIRFCGDVDGDVLFQILFICEF